MRVPSVAGPIILISIGIIALLLITGRIEADQFWTWYGHWWPLLLIGIGLVALAEWAIDLRRENPPARRFGGYFGIIVLLVILGACAGGWHRFWGPLRAQFGDDNDNFFNSLGEPQHDLDQPVLGYQDSGQRADRDPEPARRCQHLCRGRRQHCSARAPGSVCQLRRCREEDLRFPAGACHGQR